MDVSKVISFKYPLIPEKDFEVVDRGAGPKLEKWFSFDIPRPTEEELSLWNEELNNTPTPPVKPTLEERISELENIQNLQLLGVF